MATIVATRLAVPASIAVQRSALSLPVSIEVSTPNAIPPVILRGGVQVVPAVVDDTKAGDFIANLVPIDRIQVPRVVSQSVAANTRVAVGTNVDLVLVGISDIQIGILDGTRADLATTPITTALPVVQNPQVSAILQRTTDPTTLTADEKTLITNAVAPIAPIVETDPTRNFAATFATLQSLRSFE
jgi:hypothetical protein